MRKEKELRSQGRQSGGILVRWVLFYVGQRRGRAYDVSWFVSKSFHLDFKQPSFS